MIRLGDLNIDTPEEYFFSKSKSDLYLYYERFHLELKHFELKYFSSVNFFHIWLRHDMEADFIKGLPGGKEANQIIDVIEPISCFVDLSTLKKYLPPEVKKKK